MDLDGNAIIGDKALLAEGRSHFESVFCVVELIHMQRKLEVLSLYPRFFSDVEAERIGRPVNLTEIEAVLHGFAKDKAPGLDGCPVYFYLVVFDLMVAYILNDF